MKTALCALMMTAVVLTSCNKDDDNNYNYSQVGGMTTELQGYLGKTVAQIDAAMAAKGYTADHSHQNGANPWPSYSSTSLHETKSYSFSFEYEYKFENGQSTYTITGGVESADYGVESYDASRRDAYISQFEVWSDECAALKFEDYEAELTVLPSVTLAKDEFENRDEFKTAYNANKASLCDASEGWGKSTALLDQEAYCYVDVENGNYSVAVSVSEETKSSNSRSAASRKARIKSLRNSKGQTK
ncbi:MAG: hypothetical protein ACRC9X_07080 [Bacteroidales bacterium]